MALMVFGPLLVLDRFNRPTASVAALVKDATGSPVSTLALDGATPQPVVSDAHGLVQQFMADPGAGGYLLASFGSVDLAINPVGSIPTGGGGGTEAVVDPLDPQLLLFNANPPLDPTPPTAPASLTASPASTSVLLTWQAAGDDVAVTGYEYRVGTGLWVDVGAALSHNVTGLTSSTSYTFEVRAYDAVGNRGPAASVNTTTGASTDTTPPTAGTLASSSVTSSGFTLTVTGASDETALHAQPYRFSTDNGSSWSAWQASGTFNATASPSTSYTCVHQTRDAAGNVATGSSIGVTTPAEAPFTPAGSTMLTSDSFTGAAAAAGGRATDVAYGGTVVTATETVASTFDLDGAGNLTVGGTGRLMYAIATANPDVYFGLTIVTPPVEATSIRLRTGTSGSAAVSLQLKDIMGARKAELLIGGVSAGTFTIAAGDDVGVSAKGATVQAYLNGTVMASGTATVESGANHVIVAASVTQGTYFSDLVIAAI